MSKTNYFTIAKHVAKPKKSTHVQDFKWVAFWLPVPTAEYKFHSVRRWRIDYAFVDKKIAIEIEGGVFIQGRHTRGKGAIADMEKYNTLTEMGWRLLRYTPTTIDFEQIKRVYENQTA